MQYVLNVQRALGNSTTLEVGYNGSQSRHLADLINAAAPLPGNCRSSLACPIRNSERRESSS